MTMRRVSLLMLVGVAVAASSVAVVACSSDSGKPAPGGPAPDSGGDTEYSVSHDGQLSSSSVVAAGSGATHNNLQPYLALNYCIAIQGIFPARS